MSKTSLTVQVEMPMASSVLQRSQNTRGYSGLDQSPHYKHAHKLHLCSKEKKPPAQLNNSVKSRALEIANIVMKSDIYKKIEGVSHPKMTDYREFRPTLPLKITKISRAILNKSLEN